MPESVDSPAPVSTTSGRSRSRATTSSASAVGTAAVVGSTQVVEEVLGDVGDLADRLVEGGLVGRGRPGGPADLADVLQRRGRDLVAGGRRLEVVQRSDVAAHASQGT